MAKTPVLNWYAKDEKLTEGLKELFKTSPPVYFVTIRLGGKWANKLKPGSRVAISISNNPKRPKVIGDASVVAVTKTFVLNIENRDLTRNIGAKEWLQMFKDMKSVYKPGTISTSSVVSVIKMCPLP